MPKAPTAPPAITAMVLEDVNCSATTPLLTAAESAANRRLKRYLEVSSRFALSSGFLAAVGKQLDMEQSPTPMQTADAGISAGGALPPRKRDPFN